MHAAKRSVTEIFRAGAAGYLQKDCDYEELTLAIRTVVEGKTYVSPAISGAVLEDLVQPSAEESTAFSVLSQRERQVLQLLAEGHTTKQTALRLHISPKTVEAHGGKLSSRFETALRQLAAKCGTFRGKRGSRRKDEALLVFMEAGREWAVGTSGAKSRGPA